MRPRILFQKIWDEHVVIPESEEAPAVLHVDLHLIHEVTSPQAFDSLRARNLKVRHPGRILATMDHSTPTVSGPGAPEADAQAVRQVQTLARNCREAGIELHDMDSEHRGIVHVIGPELGATQPGSIIVCGDSHTSTHGAFGALAFGIGTTEVGHVLATQCLLQRCPKTMAVHLQGTLPTGVSAKDLILAVIGEIGVDGGTGHVIEYRGEAIASMSMEERMTICNMSIEAGARAGMIAPDQTTIDDLRGRPMSPTGADWDVAVERWKNLPTDEGATYDAEVTIDVSNLQPMITFGTNPGMVMGIGNTVPANDDPAFVNALEYMGIEAGESLLGKPIDVVFIGSCTNARLSDLRQAAQMMAGRQVADGVRALVVPGSQRVKRAAEAEGLHEVFTKAGADWRESGCSMCIAMNGDRVESGQYAVSTSNRNFAGRQGPGARTFLASPATAAAAAIAGRVVDPRELLAEGRTG